MNSKKRLVLLLVVAAVNSILQSPATYARNPLKDPGNEIGSTDYTLGNYTTSCKESGMVMLNTQSQLVNGHKQLFLTTSVQDSSNGINVAEAFVLRGGNAVLHTRLDNPITFQLVNGQTEVVSIVYSYHDEPDQRINFVTPNSLLKSPIYSSLTSMGNNTYMVPMGLSHGAIPKRSVIVEMIFETQGQGNCSTQTAQLNNIVFNGTNVGITTGSKQCGAPCN
ncbi:MAG TPA: hypothetical protein V6C76_03015 [Drouetiella sp.]